MVDIIPNISSLPPSDPAQLYGLPPSDPAQLYGLPPSDPTQLKLTMVGTCMAGWFYNQSEQPSLHNQGHRKDKVCSEYIQGYPPPPLPSTRWCPHLLGRCRVLQLLWCSTSSSLPRLSAQDTHIPMP